VYRVLNDHRKTPAIHHPHRAGRRPGGAPGRLTQEKSRAIARRSTRPASLRAQTSAFGLAGLMPRLETRSRAVAHVEQELQPRWGGEGVRHAGVATFAAFPVGAGAGLEVSASTRAK
jgi:hypothetical protein